MFAKTELYRTGFEKPHLEKEHGPFYTDNLLGIVIQGGNTIDNTIAFNSVNTLILDPDMYQLAGHYNYGWDEKGLSSRNWDLRGRYQRKIKEKLQPFVAIVAEGDPFAGFNDRLNFDVGVNFPFKGKYFNYNIDIGYRYTEELPTNTPERFQNKLRVHLGGEKELGKNGDIKIWFRYLPFLSDTQGNLPNYMFDYGLSVNSAFTENFYLNLTYLGFYREVPLEDRKQNDYKLIGSIGYKL